MVTDKLIVWQFSTLLLSLFVVFFFGLRGWRYGPMEISILKVKINAIMIDMFLLYLCFKLLYTATPRPCWIRWKLKFQKKLLSSNPKSPSINQSKSTFSTLTWTIKENTSHKCCWMSTTTVPILQTSPAHTTFHVNLFYYFTYNYHINPRKFDRMLKQK